MATSPQPRDPLEVTPERLTACADAVIEKLTKDTPASFHRYGQFSIHERGEAIEFLRRLGSLPPPPVYKGGLDP